MRVHGVSIVMNLQVWWSLIGGLYIKNYIVSVLNTTQYSGSAHGRPQRGGGKSRRSRLKKSPSRGPFFFIWVPFLGLPLFTKMSAVAHYSACTDCRQTRNVSWVSMASYARSVENVPDPCNNTGPTLNRSSISIPDMGILGVGFLVDSPVRLLSWSSSVEVESFVVEFSNISRIAWVCSPFWK